MGTVHDNGENGGRETHWVSDINHGEAGVAEGRRDVIYTSSGGSVGSGGNPVGKNLHRPKTGDDGTVGGTAADI